jgi:mycothiol synthase
LTAEAQDHRGWVDTMEDRARDFADPESNPATDSLAVFTPAGQLVGYGWIFTPPHGESESLSFLEGVVHPEFRKRGLGAAILTWLVQRGSELQNAIPGPQTRRLRLAAPDFLTDDLKLFARHGFEPARYFYRMRRDLHAAPIPEIRLPENLRLQAWNSSLNMAAFQAVDQAFEDHWGHIPMDEEHWRLWVLDHEYFHPELSFMVTEGAELAGVSVNKVRAAENKAVGIKEGWIQTLAVRRAWRRQGIASALLSASMQAFKAAGYDFAGLTVDTDNLTGALRIYERLGFKSISRINVFSKTIYPE